MVDTLSPRTIRSIRRAGPIVLGILAWGLAAPTAMWAYGPQQLGCAADPTLGCPPGGPACGHRGAPRGCGHHGRCHKGCHAGCGHHCQPGCGAHGLCGMCDGHWLHHDVYEKRYFLRSQGKSWHSSWYDPAEGRPIALVVPPTAEFQTQYGWGVPSSRVAPIYHQYRRPYPGPGAMPGGSSFMPTPTGTWPACSATWAASPNPSGTCARSWRSHRKAPGRRWRGTG